VQACTHTVPCIWATSNMDRTAPVPTGSGVATVLCTNDPNGGEVAGRPSFLLVLLRALSIWGT
jgi:hypothetical protein